MLAFSLIQREAKPDEVAFLRTRGEVSVAANLRAHGAHRRRPVRAGRTQGRRRPLSDARASDTRYRQCLSPTCWPNATAHSAPAVDSTLLARLDLKIGDRVTVGNATFQIRSVVDAEPDKLAGGVGFGPRFLISEAALRATGLLQPGSLVRWIYRVKLPDDAPTIAPRMHWSTMRAPHCRKPAGKSAPAATPRRSSSAASAASRNFSRWSASPRCWSAVSASPTR